MSEKLIPYDPINYIRSKEDVQFYLGAGLDGDCGDGRLLKSTLYHIARALSKNRIKHDFGMTSEDISQALSEDPNLSFATLSRITRALGLKLQAPPAEERYEEEIIYRSVSQEEAQGEILELLAVEPELCYDDISDRLRIEMEMVVDICIELEDKGVIKVDA